MIPTSTTTPPTVPPAIAPTFVLDFAATTLEVGAADAIVPGTDRVATREGS